MQKKFQVIFLSLLVLFAFNFFELKATDNSFFKYIRYSFILGSFLLSFRYIFIKSEGLVFPVHLISFSIVLSVFLANFFWYQDMPSCIMGTTPYLVFPVFFYLLHVKFPVDKIEKIVLVYGFIYIVLYFFQLTHPNKAYLGQDRPFDETRGITRILFPGKGVFYLSIFIALSKFSTRTTYRAAWLGYILLGLTLTLLLVTRQTILGVGLIVIYHFTANQNFFKKVIFMFFAAMIVFVIAQSNTSIIKGLAGVQKETVSEGENYVRVKAGKFFLFDYSPTIVNSIFGNGVPYGDRSRYGKFALRLVDVDGFYLSDVGLIGVYVMFGIFAIIGFVIIWIQNISLSLPVEYYYLKYYLWLLLVTCLTSDMIYSSGDLLVTAMVLYAYYVVNKTSRLRVTIAETEPYLPCDELLHKSNLTTGL